MKSPQILIANADKLLYQNLEEVLTPLNFGVIEALEGDRALRILRTSKTDLVIIGSDHSDPIEGLKLAEQIRKENRKIPIILISDCSSEARAIAALRAGVNDYFSLPLSFEEFLVSVQRHLENERTTSGSQADESKDIIGESKQIREIKSYLLKVAATDITVLITGETGTGKELAAEFIHRRSARSNSPFICINCAALPESLVESEMFGYERGAFTGAVAMSRGKFEQAEGGTALLDEIADMSPYAQSKILRAIEKKEVYRLGGKKAIPIDVRLTAATNKDPERLVEEEKFREDLYYRLNVARVHMPPLREHKEDLPSLVEHGIRKLNQRYGRNVEGLTDEAMASLIDYDWPGNVRQLFNLLEAAFIDLSSEEITFMDLPKAFRDRLRDTQDVPAKEREQVILTLHATRWNKSKAAQKLQWSRMTLYRKMAKYQILARPKPGRSAKRLSCTST